MATIGLRIGSMEATITTVTPMSLAPISVHASALNSHSLSPMNAPVAFPTK